MKLLNFAGPPSSGKTSVILKLVDALETPRLSSPRRTSGVKKSPSSAISPIWRLEPVCALSIIEWERLLELSKNAQRVVLVGPATTMAPVLLAAGVDDLSGFIVTDVDKALRVAMGAEIVKMSASGCKVSLKRGI